MKCAKCSIPIIREIPWDEPMQCCFPFPVDKIEASLYPSSHPWFSSFSLCLSVCLFLTPGPYCFQFISKSCWLVLSKCFQIYPLLILSTFPILVVLCPPPAQTITAASSLVLTPTLVCLPHTEIMSPFYSGASHDSHFTQNQIQTPTMFYRALWGLALQVF